MQTGWRATVGKFFIIPQRVFLAIMGFLAILNAYTMRISLSVAIVEMVVKKNHSGSSGQEVCQVDGLELEDFSDVPIGQGVYDWSEELQGIILSSFYWGYTLTHLPGGMLAEKFGGKWTLSLGILSTAIFTILTPLAIHWGGSTGLIILRVLMGLGEGTTFPALSALLAQWVPPGERAKLGSLVMGGGQVGTILGNAVSGVLLHHFDGWESVFYFFGAMGILWFIFFTLFCYSDPISHPFIKDSEKEYLQQEMGTIERNKNLPPVPWKAILTSAPLLALIAAQVGHDWGFYIMVTDLPKYMSNVLRFSIQENGLFSSLPYIVMWIVSILSGFFCDWLLKHKIIGITMARKIFTIVAAVGPAIFIVAASYAGCDRIVVVTFFTIAMGIMGAFYAGMKLNPLDLSPNYAGTLMAITNGMGAITGIIVPYLVGVMTPNASLEEWRLVFWIAFAIFVITSIIYGIWASGEVQTWNDPKSSKEAEAERGVIRETKETKTIS